MTRTSTAAPIPDVYALKVTVNYLNCHKFAIPSGRPIFIKFTCNSCRHPHAGKGIGVTIDSGNVHKASFNCSKCNLPGEAEITGPSELTNPIVFGIDDPIPQTLFKVSSHTSEPTEFLATHLKVFNVDGEFVVVLHGRADRVGEIEDVGASIASYSFIAERPKKSSSGSKK